jgi:hypothetical protein
MLRYTSSPTFQKNVSCQILSSPSERKISHDTIIFPDKLSNDVSEHNEKQDRKTGGGGGPIYSPTGLFYPHTRGNVPFFKSTGLLYTLRCGYILAFSQQDSCIHSGAVICLYSANRTLVSTLQGLCTS